LAIRPVPRLELAKLVQQPVVPVQLLQLELPVQLLQLELPVLKTLPERLGLEQELLLHRAAVPMLQEPELEVQPQVRQGQQLEQEPQLALMELPELGLPPRQQEPQRLVQEQLPRPGPEPQLEPFLLALPS
jgi:hypothetical protein